MSSVGNHVPKRSMVLPLGVAHRRGRSFRKGSPYSTSFRPIRPKSLDSPAAAFLKPPSLAQPKSGGHTDRSSCEFWCSSRLYQSRLNQQSLPLTKIPEPWGPILGSARDKVDPWPGETKPSPLEYDNGGSWVRGFPNHEQRSLDPPSCSEPSPSDYLIDTIQNMILSSNDYSISNWAFSRMSRKPLNTSLTPEQRSAFKKANNRSLQELVADYIQYIDPVLQKWKGIDISNRPRAAAELALALQRMRHEEYVERLASRGYDIKDVMAWAWVLKGGTAYEATLRIFLLEADQSVNHSSGRRIPAFIPLMLLRQKLDLKTFRLLLLYSLHIISGQSIPLLDYSLRIVSDDAPRIQIQGDTNAEPIVNPSMCSLFVVRLLSRARRLWPEAQLPIAQAFVLYLRNSKSLGDSFIAGQLNLCLRLLSLPSGPRPFISASIRQQAQFELLKAMADKKPALPVTRRGYQGLAAVQLAHKKTAAERESAELKAPSWPPWKEERSGIDSDKGVEGMRSRAMRVMSQMTEAGYPSSLWEKVTGISAGWDTDNSPTIQTRTLVRPPPTSRKFARHANDHGNDHGNDHAIWEARIRSTRTVREAWACFLAYENHGLPPHAAIYNAMGEKLLHRSYRSKQLGRPVFALPGDSLEVFPEPASARDWIFTPSEPPVVRTFLERMLSHGIRPSGRFLALLLQRAPSFVVGLDTLNCSDLTNQQLKALFSTGSSDNDIEHQRALNELPEYLFSAFIHFLCRFSVIPRRSLSFGGIAATETFPIITGVWATAQSHIPTLFSFTNPLRASNKVLHFKLVRLRSHAINLLRNRDSRNPQGWIQLLKGLRSIRLLGDPSKVGYHSQMVLGWYEILEVLKWVDERDIEIGSDGFLHLCRSFSSAVMAGVKDPDSLEKALAFLATTTQEGSERHSPSFEGMVHDGLATLKHQFERLVLVDHKASSLFDSLRLSLEARTGSQVTVPPIPQVPIPAALHAFVRSLGLAEDSDGLISLLRWMGRHTQTLKQASDEYMNGEVLMRRTIIALRLFLEGFWGKRRSAPTVDESGVASHAMPNDSVPTFSDPILQEAYDIITAAEIWGPWPSDEEVWEYYTSGERHGWD
ncbi:uncharacterized protein BJX67DRAFT_357284 [Aspergillus lucknowensis]|uniref:Uncharacterized protein n=1 Tax=Aspergillus lucknowensis TaxID=176173 RepID=A0ABR4LMK7_9EURO